MTNTQMLKSKMKSSGYRLRFIAQSINLSYPGFLNKVNNNAEFKASEMQGLTKLLKLSADEKERIFFANELDK